MYGRLLALHTHHESIFADRESNPRRGNLAAERFGKSIVASAAEHRILSAERTMHYFERRAHVVIETAHHARANFILDATVGEVLLHGIEVRATSTAQKIEDRRQRVDDRLVGFHLAIEHA